MKDWFDAKEALASGRAQPVALYCVDAADLMRRAASCFTSSPNTKPLAVAATGEDWEGDYTQVRSAIRTGNPILLASFLRDHASVLVALGRALDPTDTRTWHLVWGRKGGGRPRRASLAQPDPRQWGHVCRMDAKIVLLIASRLEKRHWDRGDLPLKKDVSQFSRKHAAFLDRLALKLDPPDPRHRHLTFRRKGAGRRPDPMLQMFKASGIAMALRFAINSGGGKQEAAIEELKARYSRAQIFREKRHSRTQQKNSRNS
jgi:hypothetical protein